MADFRTSLEDMWARMLTGSEQLGDGPLPHYFQYRHTQTPGVIEPLSNGYAGLSKGTPYLDVWTNKTMGPRVDAATTRGLAALEPLWKQRAQSHPNERMMHIDPKAAMSQRTMAHEATHSLFEEILGGDEVARKHLNAAAPQEQIVPSWGIVYPGNEASETAAYGVDLGRNNPQLDAFLADLTANAKTPEQKRAAALVWKLLQIRQKARQ